MITNIPSSTNSCSYAHMQQTAHSADTSSANNISQTFISEISSLGITPVKITSISFKDVDRIKELGSEIGKTLYEYMPKTEKFTDRSSDVHVYDVGALGREIGLPMQCTKIISQVNGTGCRTYTAILDGNRQCEIQLNVKNASPEMINKPLDATALKNVVLKALKMSADAEDAVQSIAGKNNIPSWTGQVVEYDPSTKTADYSFMKSSIERMIKDIYTRYNPDSNLNKDIYLSDALKEFEDEFLKTLNGQIQNSKTKTP